MIFRSVALAAALAASAFAQDPSTAPAPAPTPTPTPAPTPTPTPAPGSSTYSATLPGDTVEPAEPPTYEAVLDDPAIKPPPTPQPEDGAPIEPDLDPQLADPGPPPAPVPDVPRTLDNIEPSKETIEKLNAEAIAQIQAFAKSQRNPNVPDLSLDEAINTALNQNPDILNAIEQIRLTRGQLIQVRSQILPHITATSAYQQQARSLVDPKRPSSGGGGEILIPGPNGEMIPIDFSGLRGGSTYVNDKSWSVGFQASQLLYDGGGAIAGIRSAQFIEDSAYFALRQTIDQTIANVKLAFYQVILNRALVVAQQQSVNLLQEQLTDQENRYEAGTVPRFNVLQAQVALANAKPPLISALNNLRISQYNLVQVLGMDYKTKKPSEVPFNVVGTLPYNPRVINPDESIRIAIERSPALKAQRRNILANAQNVRVQFAGYLPTVTGTAGYGWQNNSAYQNLGEVTQGWSFGFNGSWAIFDGLETAGLVAQARAQLEQAAINYDNSVRQVIFDVQQAISNLQTAEETLESQQASVVQATEALRLSQERLDAGAGTQLDVLNAQVQLLQAQTTVLQARYDYLAAMANYDLALSLDAQYEEIFDDPLTPRERSKFKKITDPTAPQPPLPGKLRNEDPIEGLAANAPGAKASPTPAAKRTVKASEIIEANKRKKSGEPEPTPKPKRGKFLGIF